MEYQTIPPGYLANRFKDSVKNNAFLPATERSIYLASHVNLDLDLKSENPDNPGLQFSKNWTTTIYQAQAQVNTVPVDQDVINYDELIGVFTQNGDVRLDIGTWAMQQNTPASKSDEYTKVQIFKLNPDGSSDRSDTGFVSSKDKIGIFSSNQQCRVDLGFFATKENVPGTHKSWATQLFFQNEEGISEGGVRYGDLVGFVSSPDKSKRLNLAPPATKNCNNVSQAAGACYTPKGCVSASHSSWAAILKIQKANK